LHGENTHGKIGITVKNLFWTDRPHSSVDRALPSGGKNPRSSRGGGTKNAHSHAKRQGFGRYILKIKGSLKAAS
jgi:hypothetical protein